MFCRSAPIRRRRPTNPDTNSFEANPSASEGVGGGEAASDANNPFAHVKIFRKDLISCDSFSPNLTAQLSLDVSPKKLRDLFNDPETKRCRLCNESYQHYYTHANFIPHAGREALAFELLRPYCGTPEEIVAMWWHRLHHSKNFLRIPELSHSNNHKRKRRLQYLLQFLKDVRVVRETFSVNQGQGQQQSAGRSWSFERLEWVGDNVIKYIFNDRINVLFPFSEGGVRGRLSYTQFVVDGNESLARAYDFLELQLLTQSDRVVSKFKADVVETLFGELQLYLWSTEEDVGTEYFRLPFTPEMLSLRAIVNHVMEELGHVMMMYHLEYIVGIINRVVRDHQINFVRTDPKQREDDARRGGRVVELQAGAKLVNSVRQAHPRAHDGPAMFFAQTNYDVFKKVAPLAGLLPQSFPPHALRPSAMFLPHLSAQPAPDLSFASLVSADHGRDTDCGMIGLAASPSRREILTPGSETCWRDVLKQVE